MKKPSKLQNCGPRTHHHQSGDQEMNELERYYWLSFANGMRELHLKQAQQAANPEKPVLPLRKRISNWFCAMKWDTGRCQGYTMQQLSELFDTPPNILGPVLTEMGWVRKRDWSNGKARRYWVQQDCIPNGYIPGKPRYDAEPEYGDE